MTLSELIASDLLFGKKVVVIGRPGSGKTVTGQKLAQASNLPLVQTDTYIPCGGVEALYHMMSEMEAWGYDEPCLIEGVGSYRLLRKGAELDVFYPDVVIELVVTDEQVERVYTKERDSAKLKKMPGFVKGLETVLAGYRQIMAVRELEGRTPPVWMRLQNDF